MTAYVPGENEKNPQNLVRSLQQLAAGRSNATGTVTLTVSAAATTVVDENCSVNSVPKLVAATAHAAAEIAAGTIYIPIATITNGSFVIQHANNALADRTFSYALQG